MTQQLYQMDELDIEFITHVEKFRENLETERVGRVVCQAQST